MDNSFLIVMAAAGIVVVSVEPDPFTEMLQALEGTFVITGFVGIYAMPATRWVVRSLHKRFDAPDNTLKNPY